MRQSLCRPVMAFFSVRCHSSHELRGHWGLNENRARRGRDSCLAGGKLPDERGCWAWAWASFPEASWPQRTLHSAILAWAYVCLLSIAFGAIGFLSPYVLAPMSIVPWLLGHLARADGRANIPKVSTADVSVMPWLAAASIILSLLVLHFRNSLLPTDGDTLYIIFL